MQFGVSNNMDKIIVKYLSGSASEKEKTLLLEWLQENEKNAKFFSDIQHSWALENSKGKEQEDSAQMIPVKLNIVKRAAGMRVVLRVLGAAAAAAVIFVIVDTYIGMQRQIETYQNDISFMLTQSGSQHEYSTPYGVKGKVSLPDGSIVWLNSGSKITFPGKFQSNSREVGFSGEGYFDVKSNADVPMKISLNSGLEVNVLGTSFNLSSYDNDNQISLLLISGNVNISNSKGKELFSVLPNENVVINLADKKLIRDKPQETMPIIGWKSGWLIFEEAPLEEVFKKMERWYGQKIVVEDKSVYNKKLTAKFHEESASQVFDLMRQISLIDYKIVDSIAFIKEFN